MKIREWLLAWDNLRFNKSQTIMSIFIIALAIVSILLFRGYMNFASEGLRMSYVSQTGALQIAHKDFWAIDAEIKPNLKTDDYTLLANILDNTYGIDSYQQILGITGMIGTAQRSRFFVGDAFEEVSDSVYQMMDLGSDDADLNENGIVIGIGLADYLNIKVNDYVSILGHGGQGIAFSSLPIAGTIDMGFRDANMMFSFMTLETARNFYGMTDEFDRLRVDIVAIESLEEVKDIINKDLEGTDLEIRDWLELNPMYTDINNMNETASFWSIMMLAIFILAAISQMLQMNYYQRMGELGTLRAIGLTPKNVFLLLLRETTLMATLGVIFGLLITYAFSFAMEFFGATFTPPMTDAAYPLQMIFYLSDIIFVSLGVISVVIGSGIYPAYKAVSKPVVEVMKHV